MNLKRKEFKSIMSKIYDILVEKDVENVEVIFTLSGGHIESVLDGCTEYNFRTIDVIFAMTAGGPARATYVMSLYIIDQIWLRVNYGTGSAAGVIMLFLIASFAGYYVYFIMKKE